MQNATKIGTYVNTFRYDINDKSYFKSFFLVPVDFKNSKQNVYGNPVKLVGYSWSSNEETEKIVKQLDFGTDYTIELEYRELTIKGQDTIKPYIVSIAK